jgi:hypothetical protein
LDRRSLDIKKSRGLVNIDQRTIFEGVKIARSRPGVRRLSGAHHEARTHATGNQTEIAEAGR